MPKLIAFSCLLLKENNSVEYMGILTSIFKFLGMTLLYSRKWSVRQLFSKITDEEIHGKITEGNKMEIQAIFLQTASHFPKLYVFAGSFEIFVLKANFVLKSIGYRGVQI